MTESSRSYEALVFDLDRTLIEHDQQHENLFRTACDAIGVEPFCEPETLELATEIVSSQADGIDAFTFERRVFRTVAAAAGVDIDVTALVSAYNEALDNTAVSLRPGASEALAFAADYDTAVVTNGPERTHAQKLAAVGIEEYFDATVFGSDVARVKPARNPFDLALDRLGSSPDRVLKIGDSLERDVGGAANLGIDSAWVPFGERNRGPDEPEPTYSLSSLAELPDILV